MLTFVFSSYVIALYKNDFDERPLNFGYLTLHKKSRQKCLPSNTIYLHTFLATFDTILNFKADFFDIETFFRFSLDIFAFQTKITFISSNLFENCV